MKYWRAKQMPKKIFTTEHGSVEVCWVGWPGDTEPNQKHGWRAKADGSREKVFWSRSLGWKTDTEINDARVRARTFR